MFLRPVCVIQHMYMHVDGFLDRWYGQVGAGTCGVAHCAEHSSLSYILVYVCIVYDVVEIPGLMSICMVCGRCAVTTHEYEYLSLDVPPKRRGTMEVRSTLWKNHFWVVGLFNWGPNPVWLEHQLCYTLLL